MRIEDGGDPPAKCFQADEFGTPATCTSDGQGGWIAAAMADDGRWGYIDGEARWLGHAPVGLPVGGDPVAALRPSEPVRRWAPRSPTAT